MEQNIFNQTQGYGVSNKYVPINTASLVAQFQAAGFTLDRVSKAKVKDPARQGFQKHLLVFRNESLALRNVNDSVPEILLKNSYDGTSSFQLFLGIYRLVCANGLMVGTTYETVRVRHVGLDAVSKAIDGALRITKQVETASETIQRMQATTLSESQLQEFARQAWAIVKPESAVAFDASSVLRQRRAADASNDLWSVFNRAQENLIRGGVRFQTVNALGQVRNASRRAVRSIDASVEINRKLWTIAESFTGVAA